MSKPVTKTVPILTRVSPDLKARLKAIAEGSERSESYVAAQAIASFVELNEWQARLVASRLAQADGGAPTVPHDDVAAWIESKGTGHPLPKPAVPPRR